MADRRPEADMPRAAKRIKSDDGLDPASNPYLAHMYTNGDGGSRNGSKYGSSPIAHFKRFKTTAEQAHAAEDGPENPFNAAPLSDTYFSILKVRRDLPVHKQRYVRCVMRVRLLLTMAQTRVP
jgi:pre-mRNA-splicing factor ATP-dependent RNA helicase DHX15/PRP43